jgi:hypothetical protein
MHGCSKLSAQLCYIPELYFSQFSFLKSAEADLDEFRAGIHNDRGFGDHFQASAAGDGVCGGLGP